VAQSLSALMDLKGLTWNYFDPNLDQVVEAAEAAK